MIRIDVSHLPLKYIQNEIIPCVRHTIASDFAYSLTNGQFIFSNELDSISFILKWGGNRVNTTIIDVTVNQFEK